MAEMFIMAIDQGTTSSRAIIFNHAGQIVSSGQLEHEQIFPRAGWVEHNPDEIRNSVNEVMGQAFARARINRHQIAAVGITNQRETTLVWDRETGEPVYNAIVWQDTRTQKICDELAGDEGPDRFKEICGLPLATYFAGPKIKWILDNVEGAREKADAGKLAFGTMDSWVLWNLTGGQHGGVHVTDVTNASRTMLMNVRTLEWDPGMCEVMGIPMSMLPEIRSCSEVYGHGDKESLIIDTPIAGILGDQQAATFGQACFQKGMAKNTYGTGCFLLMHTGRRAVASNNGLIATCAAQTGEALEYALEGSVFIAGAVVQWLRDGLGLVRQASDIEALAASVPDAGGVVFVPAFAGLGAPHWNPHVRGTLAGLTRGTGAAHIARAALEAIAFQSAELVQAMAADCGRPLAELRVDGGATANNLLMQFQADLLGVPVVRPRIQETTALGAAYLAGLAAGVWHGREEIAAQWERERSFEPALPAAAAAARMAEWRRAVRCALTFAE